MSRLFLGIDPGLTGALALLDARGALFQIEDLPTIARGKGRVKQEIDAAGLARLLRQHAGDIELAVVEQVSAMPGQGVASVFSLGHTYGAIVGVLQALAIPLQLVTPAQWKKAAGVGTDKDLVRAAAVRLYPEAPLELKKHHNRAEALLLARHATKGPGNEH